MFAPAPPQPTGIALPSLDDMDPRDWIAAVWTHYLELWPKILGLQHEAAELAATSTGWVHDAARSVVTGCAELSKIHSATVRKVEEYSGYLGLGAITVTTAALAVAALAALILWSFRRYDALSETLAAIRDGVVTPDQAADLMDSAGPIPDVGVLGGLSVGVVVGVAAVLGLLVVAARSGAFRARRENPDLMLLGMNPPGVWSERVLQLDYIHSDNGQPYTHTFRPGVQMQALEDGSVRLFHPRRKIWKEF